MGAGIPITYDNKWIIDNWRSFKNWGKMCKAYNEIHGTSICYNTFKCHCNRELGLNYHYTEEQLEWLRNNYPKLGRIKCQKEFNRIFNEDRSIQGLRVMCTRMGLTVTKERKREIFRENTKRYHPTGSIVKKSHGEPYVKTETGWKRLKDINYGSKPKGHIIIHLDGDVNNYDRSNLLAIPRNVNAKMTLNSFWSQFPEVTKAGALCCELELLTDKP